MPPNADRDGSAALTARGTESGLGSYPPQPKAPPTPHGRAQLCLQQGA